MQTTNRLRDAIKTITSAAGADQSFVTESLASMTDEQVIQLMQAAMLIHLQTEGGRQVAREMLATDTISTPMRNLLNQAA